MTRVTKKQEALLDELIKGCNDPQDILRENGLLHELQKRLVERALPNTLVMRPMRPRVTAAEIPAMAKAKRRSAPRPTK